MVPGGFLNDAGRSDRSNDRSRHALASIYCFVVYHVRSSISVAHGDRSMTPVSLP